ncbi:MAG: hypothetical protein IPH31_22830 [Lewinellaceae bacterium]|nr:hypothetical protein [Lewinellaceae bacterium]
MIGYVEITKDGNPQIIDATNRQDFVDTPEYRALKKFIIDQLDVFSAVKIYERTQKKLLNESGYEDAIKGLQETKKLVTQVEKGHPQLTQSLEPLRAQLDVVIQSSKKNLEEQKKAQKEFLRKENIYLSLMSLQDYAITVAHAVRTSIGKILRMAEFFKDKFRIQKYEEQFKINATRIYNEMLTLNRVTDFMLSYAGSNLDFQDLNIKN